MFIAKKGHQPGVYVPLGALFLVVSICDLVHAVETMFHLSYVLTAFSQASPILTLKEGHT